MLHYLILVELSFRSLCFAEQDVKNQTILQEVDESSDEYLRKVKDLAPDQRKAEMEKIQKMFKKAKAHGEDKVKAGPLGTCINKRFVTQNWSQKPLAFGSSPGLDHHEFLAQGSWHLLGPSLTM